MDVFFDSIKSPRSILQSHPLKKTDSAGIETNDFSGANLCRLRGNEAGYGLF
jgi:hypothetical protein